MKRGKRRARPGKDDAAYLRWIRLQACCCCGAAPPNHAHHVTGAGTGCKASDRDTMPLCGLCHRDLHEFRGMFEDMTRENRAAWQAQMVEHYRAEHERQEVKSCPATASTTPF